MTMAQKYFFNTDFDEEAKKVLLEIKHEAEVKSQIEDEEEAVPTFSEEELQAAKTDAFNRGKDEGVRGAANTTEQCILETLNALTQQTQNIFQGMEDINTVATQNAMSIGASMVKKLFPHLNARQATDEVEIFIQTTIQQVISNPKLRVRVNSSLFNAISERFASMTSNVGKDDTMELIPDGSIEEGDCQIEWESGGASRNVASMWQEIDEILNRNLGEPWATMQQVSDAITHEATSSAPQEDTPPEPSPTESALEAGDTRSKISEIIRPITDHTPTEQGD